MATPAIDEVDPEYAAFRKAIHELKNTYLINNTDPIYVAADAAEKVACPPGRQNAASMALQASIYWIARKATKDDPYTSSLAYEKDPEFKAHLDTIDSYLIKHCEKGLMEGRAMIEHYFVKNLRSKGGAVKVR